MNLGTLKKKIGQKIEDSAGLALGWNVLKDTLGKNTVGEIRGGKVFVSNQTINEAIAKYIAQAEHAPLQELGIAAHGDGSLDISAKAKDGRSVSFAGAVERFTVKNGTAVFVYRAEKHELSGGVITSWLFSNLTLGIMSRFIGMEKMPGNVDVEVTGNTVTADFSRVLADSRLGQTTIKGIPLANRLEIEHAIPKDGGIELKTRLNLDDIGLKKTVSGERSAVRP